MGRSCWCLDVYFCLWGLDDLLSFAAFFTFAIMANQALGMAMRALSSNGFEDPDRRQSYHRMRFLRHTLCMACVLDSLISLTLGVNCVVLAASVSKSQAGMQLRQLICPIVGSATVVFEMVVLVFFADITVLALTPVSSVLAPSQPRRSSSLRDLASS